MIDLRGSISLRLHFSSNKIEQTLSKPSGSSSQFFRVAVPYGPDWVGLAKRVLGASGMSGRWLITKLE